MEENNDRINRLLEKWEILLKRQDNFYKEINALRDEISMLKASPINKQFVAQEEIVIATPEKTIEVEHKVETITEIYQKYQAKRVEEQPKELIVEATTSPKPKSDIEKFIGENLINKIGIAITVIGVAIGAKYSIEHQLISPLTRIILGYLMGIGLLGFGIKLKQNYESYSAVLVSGAIAIMYFITYASYSFYGLIPQTFAFMLMVIFTAFAVVAAIHYNKQVIAHVGLVGAYAVPFLLSDGSGKIAVLFVYMGIINIGILFIAFKKYWKSLYYVSFALTWIIFFSWFNTKYQVAENFALALMFLSIFFATFYFIFLAYKLVEKEKFEKIDIMLLLSNSFIFFGLGYSILDSHKTGAQLLGLFTLGNAIIHFVVSTIIYKQKLADRNLFFLVAGLVLVFITIAIPVQLDGNWVTLLWVGEAALLFWIGRTKSVSVYEKLSYPIMLLAFFSIVQDWLVYYDNSYPGQAMIRFTSILNIHFLTSMLFVAAFGFINYLNNNKKYTSALSPQKIWVFIIEYSIPVIFFVVLYFAFRMEISAYWNQLYADSAVQIKKATIQNADGYWNEDYNRCKIIWVINYSLLFFSILSYVNIKRLKNKDLGQINIVLNIIVLLVFLVQGLLVLSELRETYLSQTLAQYYHRTGSNITIRYVSYAFFSLTLMALYKYIRQSFIQPILFNLRVAFDFIFYISLLWILSSELIAWMDIMKFTQSYKLGLSILWGMYALVLIALGIGKKKKHLRIGAIVLFAITLIKLFFYDISELDTIAKTIVFVSLGILLLIISFLYNKYKNLITAENEN